MEGLCNFPKLQNKAIYFTLKFTRPFFKSQLIPTKPIIRCLSTLQFGIQNKKLKKLRWTNIRIDLPVASLCKSFAYEH